MQTGIGRTGTLFACEQAGVAPDIMGIAKGLGGGFPIGACLATGRAASGLTAGSHGSTFGGNPLACAVANAVLDVVLGEGFLAEVRARAAELHAGLQALVLRYPGVLAEARGVGLLAGVRAVGSNAELAGTLRDNGLLSVLGGANVVRLLPPLIVTADEVGQALAMLDSSLHGAGGVRRFLDLDQVETADLDRLLRRAAAFKAGDAARPMAGRTLAMIFDKPSTRTRVSFEVAAKQLGGDALVLTARDMQLGRGESIADTARVLSRYVDAIMLRTDAHAKLLELAAHATVPVINGLTDHSHPCQIMADVLTIEEHRGPIRGQTVAWCGDGNNVLTSLIHAASRLDFALNIACPPELSPEPEVLAWAKERQARIRVTSDPAEAVAGVAAVFADTWVSMGDADQARRHALLEPYRVDAGLMARAAPDALFLHCLPAHRGEEVSAEVIDGPQSVVFDEAENRLHVQKAILEWCLGGAGS